MPRGELAPVMMITLSFTRLQRARPVVLSAGSVFVNGSIWMWGRVRSCRVARYAADLGDVFEGAGVGGLDDELLAEGSEAGSGARCHAGICEGFDEPSVFIGWHCCRRGGGDKTLGDVGKRWPE